MSRFNQLHLLSTLCIFYFIYLVCGSQNVNFDEINVFYNWKERFSDLVELFFAVKNNNPYFASEAWHISFYPPFAYLLVSLIKYCCLDNFYKWLLVVFILFFLVCYRYASNNGYKFFSNYGIFCSLFFLSVPVYFSIDRGNLEILCILLVFAAFAEKNKYLSSVFIGLAAAIKLVPIIFAFYYLSKANFKYLLTSIATFFFATFIALLIFDGPAIGQISRFLSNISSWSQASLVDPKVYSEYLGPKTDLVQAYTVDLFDAIRILLLKSGVYYSGSRPYLIYKVIWFFLVGGTLLVLPFLKDSEKLLALSTLAIVITPLTYVYRLAYLYIFILYYFKESRSDSMIWILLVLLIPKPYLHILYRVDINQILIPFCLTFILVRIVTIKFYENSVLNYWREWICRK